MENEVKLRMSPDYVRNVLRSLIVAVPENQDNPAIVLSRYAHLFDSLDTAMSLWLKRSWLYRTFNYVTVIFDSVSASEYASWIKENESSGGDNVLTLTYHLTFSGTHAKRR